VDSTFSGIGEYGPISGHHRTIHQRGIDRLDNRTVRRDNNLTWHDSLTVGGRQHREVGIVAIRGEHSEHEQYDSKCRKQPTEWRGERLGTPEVIAVLQDLNTNHNTDNDADDAPDSREVSAAEADPGTDRAAEKHKSRTHEDEPENESQDRRAATPRLELLGDKRCSERPQYDADDLGRM